MEQSKKYIIKKYSKVCPECGSSVYYRKTKYPKFRCTHCGTKTNNPKRKRCKLTSSKLRKQFHALFYKKHRNEIINLFYIKKEKAITEYMEFKDVIILCRKCHFAYHKGLKLCSECKINYHTPKHEKCWTCFQNNK